MPQAVLLADASGTSQNSQNAEQIPQAANSSEAQTFQLDETVITATGYEQDIKYAPASVSVVPKDEIVSRPVKDLGDIVQDVPGVTIDPLTQGISNISLRGMDEDYTLILVDGKRMSPSKGVDANGYNSSAGYIPPLSMIERVEVIKGPSSLRYGSEAMGGVINIITKKTPDKTTATVSLSARLQEHHANWGNTYNFDGTVFHPINEYFAINLRGKVSYNEENHIYAGPLVFDGTNYSRSGPGSYYCSSTMRAGMNCFNPYVRSTPSNYQTASVGGRITFTMDEQNTFYLDTDFIFQRIGSLNTSPNLMGEKRDYEKLKVLLNHDGKYDFGDINTYLQYNGISRMTSLNKYYEPEKLAQNVNGRDHGGLLYNPIISGASTFTTNLDLGSAGALIFNAGPSFFYERSYSREGTSRLNGRAGSNYDDDGYQIAVFGEGEYLPLNWLGVVAGVRVNYANGFGVYAAPRAYLSFYPASWLTLKAGFASGFQVPDLKMRHKGYYDYTEFSWLTYYGNEDLKMEKSYNYEVTAIVDSPFANFSLTGYITDYRDWITNDTVTHGSPMLNTICETKTGVATDECHFYYNVGEMQLWGAELAINSKALLQQVFARWGGGIFVDIGYAYTDSNTKTEEKGANQFTIPIHTLTGKLSYKTSNWQLYTRYRGTYNKTTSVNASYNLPKYYKDLHMMDLGTSYRFENGITLGFVINNLLDIDTVGEFWQAGTPLGTSSYGVMVPGRNYWLNVSADF